MANLNEHMEKVGVSKVMVKEYCYKNYSFCLVKLTNDYYGAINYDYITNGRINRVLSGFNLFMEKELNEVLVQVKNWVDVKELIENGWDELEAIKKVVLG